MIGSVILAIFVFIIFTFMLTTNSLIDSMSQIDNSALNNKVN